MKGKLLIKEHQNVTENIGYSVREAVTSAGTVMSDK
jgi:hypothetical protein